HSDPERRLGVGVCSSNEEYATKGRGSTRYFSQLAPQPAKLDQTLHARTRVGFLHGFQRVGRSALIPGLREGLGPCKSELRVLKGAISDRAYGLRRLREVFGRKIGQRENHSRVSVTGLLRNNSRKQVNRFRSFADKKRGQAQIALQVGNSGIPSLGLAIMPEGQVILLLQGFRGGKVVERGAQNSAQMFFPLPCGTLRIAGLARNRPRLFSTVQALSRCGRN